MKTQVLTYNVANGWSEPLPRATDSAKTLVLVFGGSEFFDVAKPFDELNANFPNSHILGCSTAGGIDDASIVDNALIITIIQFDSTELQSSSVEIKGGRNSYETGTTLANQLNQEGLKAVFVLSEGLNVNGSELVRGFNDCLDEKVVITGGLAGDDDRFEHTWVIHHGKPQANYVSAVAFYGDNIRVGHGSKGGWDIFGPERLVTKSDGNVLFELDGQPALELYKEYLGEMAAELPASALRFPLSLRDNQDSEKKLVRTILSIDESENSMTFAGDVPEGSLAQLMHANMDRLIEGAEEAAIMTKDKSNGDVNVLAIAVSCVGRRIVLGESAEDEVEATLDILPDNSQQIGFYSYGELSPYASGSCDLHNQTMTITTLHEV